MESCSPPSESSYLAEIGLPSRSLASRPCSSDTLASGSTLASPAGFSSSSSSCAQAARPGPANRPAAIRPAATLFPTGRLPRCGPIRSPRSSCRVLRHWRAPSLLRLPELGDHLLPVALLVGEGDLLADRRQPDVPAALLREDVGLAVEDDPAGLLVGLGDDPGHLRPGGRVGGPGVPGPRDGAEQGERPGERK